MRLESCNLCVKMTKDKLKSRIENTVHRAFKRAELKQTREYIKRGLLEIGEHTYGLPIIESYRGSEAKVEIGKYCSLGPRLRIITGGIHPIDWVSTYPFRIKNKMDSAYTDGMPCTKGPVIIRSDVWIGSDVTIMSGVEIGDGCVVCSSAVVTKSFPPYSMIGGVPAQLIKMRFSEEIISRLLEIKWWEFPHGKVLQFVDYLSSNNIDGFLQAIDER